MTTREINSSISVVKGLLSRDASGLREIGVTGISVPRALTPKLLLRSRAQIHIATPPAFPIATQARHR